VCGWVVAVGRAAVNEVPRDFRLKEQIRTLETSALKTAVLRAYLSGRALPMEIVDAGIAG
jgi:hypothetical protein